MSMLAIQPPQDLSVAGPHDSSPSPGHLLDDAESAESAEVLKL